MPEHNSLHPTANLASRVNIVPDGPGTVASFAGLPGNSSTPIATLTPAANKASRTNIV